MITDEQIRNSVTVGMYSVKERAAYEHGVGWGLKIAAEAIRRTGEDAPPGGVGPAVKATCGGLALALEKQAAEVGK